MNQCPLCESSESSSLLPGELRFWQCQVCQLIFLDPSLRLHFKQEKDRYLQHNNDLQDYRYLTYLDQLWSRLYPLLPKTGVLTGIDYGCGPTRGLEQLCRATNLEQEKAESLFSAPRFGDSRLKILSYDPLFFPLHLNDRIADFVFCNEVAEHFSSPAKEFNNIVRVLRPGSLIALRTELCVDVNNFNSWYYHRDPTHVSFYTPDSIYWLAKSLNLKVLTLNERFAILKMLDFKGGSDSLN